METKQFYYGIDVSQNSLQIALQLPNGQWQESSINNQIQDINNWLLSLDLPNSGFVFEYTGTYSQRLSYSLQLHEAFFSILTPTQSRGFALSLKKTSKTDRQDARLLALYGQKMQPSATIIADDQLLQKRQKYKHLAVLKSEKQAFSNRLEALSYQPKSDPIVVKSLQDILAFFEQQIQELTQNLFTIDDQESQRITKLMTKVVGIGVASANAILISTNGFKEFDNPKQVAKFIGVAPTDKQSGSSVRGKGSINKSSCASVRTTLYMAAQSAARFNNACKELFQRLRAKGKPYKVAIIAVINKLIKQLFAVVKNNTEFDNNYSTAK